MKTQSSKIALCAFVILLLAMPVTAMAEEQDAADAAGKEKRVGFSFGYRQYYLWWNPVWAKTDDRKNRQLLPMIASERWHTMHNFAYNPIMAVRWSDRWSLSGSFTYAHYENSSIERRIVQTNVPIIILHPKDRKINKFDADLLFSIKIKPWFNIFFGPKYYGYRISTKGDFILGASGSYIISPGAYRDKPSFHSGGMGIGTGFHIPLIGNFMFQTNVALLGFGGWDSSKGSSLDFFRSKNKIAWSIGAIGDIHFAYFIPAAHLYLAAGGRAQYQYFIQKARKTYIKNGDLYYGPSFTVMFVF